MNTNEILTKQIEATIWLLENDTASSHNPEQLYCRLGKCCVAFMQRELPKSKNPETYRVYQRMYKRRIRKKAETKQ